MKTLQETIDFRKQEIQALEKSIENDRVLFSANRADYLQVINSAAKPAGGKLDLIQFTKAQNQQSASLFETIDDGWR